VIPMLSMLALVGELVDDVAALPAAVTAWLGR
jgi:hypothetical protein